MNRILKFVFLLLTPLVAFSQSSESIVSSGTGFLVSAECHIVTNKHVIAGAKKIRAVIASGEVWELELLKVDSQNDLAVLTSNRKGCKALGVAQIDALRKGDAVHTLGFPRPNTQGRESKFTTGIVSSLSGIQGDTKILQISTPIQPGNSGGPLLDDAGNVVGVIVAKLKADSDVAPEAVNYAVKGSILAQFLKTVDALGPNQVRGAPVQSKHLSLPVIAERVENSVVLLLAEQERIIPKALRAIPKPYAPPPPNTPPATPIEVDGQMWIRPIEVLAESPADPNFKGVTFVAPTGSDVRAAAKGKVIWAGGETGHCKKRLMIQHGGGFMTRYENICVSFVRFDESVEQGHVIGTIKEDLAYYIYKKSPNLTPVDPKPYLPPLQ